VVLNVAEGAGKFSPQDKSAFYTRARGSATESAAVLDVCFKLTLIAEAEWAANKTILVRIVEMLTKLIKTHQQNAADRG
jgi:four helix bundle protein